MERAADVPASFPARGTAVFAPPVGAAAGQADGHAVGRLVTCPLRMGSGQGPRGPPPGPP